MGMTTDEEAATAQGQDAITNAQATPARPHLDETTEPARSAESASGGGPGEAAPPAELRTAHGKSDTSPASQEAGPEVGWFSAAPGAGETGADQHDGTPSQQLSAERPGDEPPEGLSAGVASAWVPGGLDMPAAGTADPVGAESSTVPDGSSAGAESSGASKESSGVRGLVAAGEPLEGVGSSSAVNGPGPPEGSSGAGRSAAGDVGESADPQASSGRDTGSPSGADRAALGPGSVPVRQELHGQELIQSGMGYVDPDPETGSPPSAAGWTERSGTGLLPNDGPSRRASAAVPEKTGAEQAEPRDVVNSPDAGAGRGRETDSLGVGAAAPADDPEAGRAADRGSDSATDQAAIPSREDATRSTQVAPEAKGKAPSGSSGPVPASDGEGTSIGKEKVRVDRAADDPHAIEQVVSAPVAAAENAEPTRGAATLGGTSSPAADPEQGAGTAEVGTEGIRLSKVADTTEVGSIGEADGDAEAGGVAGPANAAEASSQLTTDDTDDTPWNEPALPMAWPPGLGPPGRGATSESSGREELDPELLSEPVPTWPRLFGQGLDSEESGAAADHSNERQAAAGSGQEAGRAQSGESAAEHRYSRAEEAIGQSGGESDAQPSTRESQGPVDNPGDQATSGAAAAAGAAPIIDHPAERSADEGRATTREAFEVSDAVPAGAADAGESLASGDVGTPPSNKPTIVDVASGEPGGTREPATQPGVGPRSVERGSSDARAVAAPVSEGGVGASEHTNISTAIQSGEAGEVDLREVSASPPSVDVSRETSVDGGEAMDPELDDETLEDEAAIAVRDAVSRAAAEAGVDVSRETEPVAADFSIDAPAAEATIDSEAAARDARVTFRIHRSAQNAIRRVLAVANQKGGVGKSTTAVNIGAYLALAGARVLVIDLDPQGNASTGLGLDHRDIEPSIYDVLTGEAGPGAAIRVTGVPNLYVLPSTIDLAGAEVELVSAMSRETRLRRALQSIDHQYDTILIDCPPSLGLLTVNALAAADELLIPIQCEYYALEGLGQLLRNVELVRANLNPELRIGGIVLTMYDGRTRLALQVVDEVRRHFTDLVYQTVVPRSVRLSEAPGYGLPIALYDPLSRGGIAYRDLTFELAERSGLLAPTGEGAS
jgi:chromosome partitioning protein